MESSAAPISEPGDASHSAVEKLVSPPVSGKHCLPLAEEMNWITESSLFCWYNKTARCCERWWKWERHSLLETENRLFEGLVLNILYENSGYFLWKSIFVREDFLIFCSQCHSRTRSAVYADNSNPWHPKTKHDHPSHWRYVGMYTEYRHYVCSSIFSSLLLNPCAGSRRCWRVNPDGEHAKPELESSFRPPVAGNCKIGCYLHSQWFPVLPHYLFHSCQTKLEQADYTVL